MKLTKSRRPWLIYATLIALACLCAYEIHHWYKRGYPLTRERSPFQLNLGNLAEWQIEIEPEFISALNAATPNLKSGCQKVRYKWVPVRSVSLDGRRLIGKYALTYRGYCHYHWAYRQKSFKLKQVSGERLAGYRVLNFNAFNTDAGLFEVLTTQLYRRFGGVASRSNVVKMKINGTEDGLRIVSENLDNHLLVANGVPKGPIYREKTKASLGKDIPNIKQVWQKNTYESDPWTDWIGFNNSIASTIETKSHRWDEYLDAKQYIYFLAFTNLIGSDHFFDHNIVMYRPRKDKKFTPIGYDFYEPNLSSNSSHFSALHYPTATTNLLSRLIWSIDTMRLDIHRLTMTLLQSEIPWESIYKAFLNEVGPEIVDSVHKGLTLNALVKEENRADFNLNEYLRTYSDLETFASRLKMLRQDYLTPLARIAPGWQTGRKTSILLEGYGMYTLAVHVDKASCVTNPEALIRVRIQSRKWHEIKACRQNRPILIEHDRIFAPGSLGETGVERLGIGATLIEVANENGLTLRRLDFRSMQTGNPIATSSEMPFLFEKEANATINLETDLPFLLPKELETKQGIGWIPTNKDYVKAVRKDQQITFVNIPIPLNTWLHNDDPFKATNGSILCWNMQGRKNCFEFDRRILIRSGIIADLSFFAQPHRPKYKNENRKILSQEMIQGKTEVNIGPGEIKINEAIIFESTTKVTFLAGTKIYFAPRSFMVIQGDVQFPEEPPHVVFDSLRAQWGGLVIANAANPVVVQNASFGSSQEVASWRDRAITGALTIIDAKQGYTISNSKFNDIFGDDAVNIAGGSGEIVNNIFINARDSIDVDRGKALIKGNKIINSHDDGIDVGEKASVKITDNIICKSGDKAISVGEGSHAVINNNKILSNNVGIATKDGSTIEISKNLIAKNYIGLSQYQKNIKLNSSGGKAAQFEGRSFFLDNQIDVKIDGKTSENGDWKAPLPANLEFDIVSDCIAELGSL